MQSHYKELNESTHKALDAETSCYAKRHCWLSFTKAALIILIGMTLFHCRADANDVLADKIYSALTKNLPTVKPDVLRYRSFSFAKQASPGANSFDTLNANLLNVFKSGVDADALDWNQNKRALTQAAAQVAGDLYPDDNAKHLYAMGIALGDTNNIWGHLSLWTGARFSNPYKISTNNTLTSAGSTSDGYIEINLSSRFVERSGSIAQDPNWFGRDNSSHPKTNEVYWAWPWQHMPDVDTRIGYLFRNKSSPSNFSATTVGSSDFYGDSSIGFPMVRFLNENWKQQLSIEVNGGFATDKDVLSLHPNFFLGMGWQASFKAVGTTNMGYWYGRAGYALIDQPVLSKGTNTVILDHLGEPKFDLKWTPSVGVIFTYPMTSTLNLQAGANAYFTDRTPASWNASLGVSLDVDKFFK
jgi:hypothetical protein